MINLVSPPANGLFHRAVCESSCPAMYDLATRTAAEATGIAFAKAAGCGSGTGPDVAQCLRDLPAARVEELAGTPSAFSTFVIGSGIVDGQIVPDQPLTLFKSGKFNHVPLMNGATSDEWNFMLWIAEVWSSATNTPRTPPTAAQYRDYMNTTFAPPRYIAGTATRALALYPLGAFTKPQFAWERAASDALRICNSRSLDKILSSHITVYAYEFADGTAPSYMPDLPGFELGAYHTADIQYLFPLWHGGPEGIMRPLNKHQAKLSDQIIAAWANFARTGDPNGTGDSPWPRYSVDSDTPGWLIEEAPVPSALTDEAYARLHHCDFWDSVLAVP